MSDLVDRLRWSGDNVECEISSVNEDCHELFKPEDFTHHEYVRGNKLAVAVIDGGLCICKKVWCCGNRIELNQQYCGRRQYERRT